LLLCLTAVVLLAVPACRAAEPAVDATGMPVVQPNILGSTTGTDTGTQARENESLTTQTRRIREGETKFEFQAEVNRLMDILINSLYSNKDIFLRELISNASDALDKIRFLSLTDKAVLGEGDNAKLEIQLSLDPVNKVLTIRDRGVGMTKEDLITNLGTIAKSGTAAFLENLTKSGDVNLIGQFGVGFYSIYLVADWVEVVSKHNDDKQHVWSSDANGGFTIAEDKEGEDIGRGTLIRLHLKPEAMEYAEEAKLRELVGRYSEFINFPIYLLSEKEVEVPVEEEEEAVPAEDKEEAADADDVEDDDSDDDSTDETKTDETPKTKTVKKKEWDLLNDNKAIWLRKPQDVGKEDYHKFYKAISKDSQEPMGWSHFKAEGDVEFKAVIFVPKTVQHDFYDKYYEKGAKGALKLYVRRVFITDDADTLLPRWLGFLRGIVDSDTLPLNVSREMMQQNAALKTIKKKIVRKVLDLIKKWADDEQSCRKGDNAKELEEADSGAPGMTGCELYAKFWEQYGRSLKLGMIEDPTNRNRLTKLMRFHTSKSTDQMTSFDEYVSRMKEGQKDIYYLAGTSKDEIAASPFVEQLLKKGYEVIYFTDVLDEYVMQHVLDYDDKKFANASKEDLKLSDKDDQEKKREKELKSEFKELTTWWKKALGMEVTNVKVSTRLATTPCVVVAGKYGHSANMERIMRAQAFQDPNKGGVQKGTRTLEINPRHPMIRAIRDKVAATGGEASEEVTNLARILFDAAVLESGYLSDNPKAVTQRMQALVSAALGVASDSVLEDDVPEIEEIEEDDEDIEIKSNDKEEL